MIIGFCSAHSIGKSTLVNEIKKIHPVSKSNTGVRES
jgi:hypothetical protein